MLVRVSGWSGPSLAFLSSSVSSNSGRARSSLPGGLVAAGEVVHAGERVGVVGAELGLPSASVSSNSGRAWSSWPAAW